jgi:hypothetical protein
VFLWLVCSVACREVLACCEILRDLLCHLTSSIVCLSSRFRVTDIQVVTLVCGLCCIVVSVWRRCLRIRDGERRPFLPSLAPSSAVAVCLSQDPVFCPCSVSVTPCHAGRHRISLRVCCCKSPPQFSSRTSGFSWLFTFMYIFKSACHCHFN